MSRPEDVTQQFAAAAVRHADDATHLLSTNRHVTADHLAGFAAECFLKAMLLGFLGGKMGKIKPETPDPAGGKPLTYGHLPELWSDLSLRLGGRTGATLGGLLSSEHPFIGWKVDDRYTDGRHVQMADTQKRVDVANRLRGIYEFAQLNGAL